MSEIQCLEGYGHNCNVWKVKVRIRMFKRIRSEFLMFDRIREEFE